MTGSAFFPGDMVIKVSGGNKMRVTDAAGGMVSCIWATDSIHSGVFHERELMRVDRYEEGLVRQSERQGRIDQALG